MKIGAFFEKEVKARKAYVVLATVDPKHYEKTNLELVKHMIREKKIPGVYVTLNKPYDTVKERFDSFGIDTDKIIFIDAVSKPAGGGIMKTKHCLFIGNPENLSDISLAMDQAVRAFPHDKFLFFDSLSTLLLYNSSQTVARFIHFMASKMRLWKVQGIIISLHKTVDKDLIADLSQFCDVIIDFGRAT